jgi:preprotein translocase subunit SecA
MGMAENEALEASMLSGAIERAQRKVEENDFGTRKRLVDYDDVMNNQREVVYTKRRNALTGERIDVDVLNMTTDYCEMFVEQNKDLDFESFCEELRQTLSVEPDFDEKFYEKSNRAQLTEALQQSLLTVQQRRFDALVERAWPIIKYVYETKRMFYQNIAIPVSDGKLVYTILVDLKKAYESKGREVIRAVEKTVTLRVIDEYWKDHLRDMDDLKQSVQNAAYEQKDPIVVYKTESYDLFITMLENLNKDVLAFLLRAQIYLRQEQQPEDVVTEGHEKRSDMSRMKTSRPDLLTNSSEQKSNAPIHVEKRVGRNDPCPCGSGKKFKNCHGREA